VIGLAIGPWDKWEYVIDLNAAGTLEGHNIPNDTLGFINLYSTNKNIREFAQHIHGHPDSIKGRQKVVHRLNDIKLYPPYSTHFTEGLYRISEAHRGHQKGQGIRGSQGMGYAARLLHW
jgi:hypothetical protein